MGTVGACVAAEKARRTNHICLRGAAVTVRGASSAIQRAVLAVLYTIHGWLMRSRHALMGLQPNIVKGSYEKMWRDAASGTAVVSVIWSAAVTLSASKRTLVDADSLIGYDDTGIVKGKTTKSTDIKASSTKPYGTVHQRCPYILTTQHIVLLSCTNLWPVAPVGWSLSGLLSTLWRTRHAAGRVKLLWYLVQSEITIAQQSFVV